MQILGDSLEFSEVKVWCNTNCVRFCVMCDVVKQTTLVLLKKVGDFFCK